MIPGFHYLALFAIGATTVWSALAAFCEMFAKGRAELSDILLLFIYLEIGAMVGIYFKTTRRRVRYLIYIAITALGRVLIEIGGAEHKTGQDLLVVAGRFWPERQNLRQGQKEAYEQTNRSPAHRIDHGPMGRPYVVDVKEGDIWYFPTGYPHSLQGLGPDGCEFVICFDNGEQSEFNTLLPGSGRKSCTPTRPPDANATRGCRRPSVAY
jgi:phosphate starvation-inducible membrane PsiE